MNLVTHGTSQGGVDHPVSFHSVLTLKFITDYDKLEVISSARRVTHVHFGARKSLQDDFFNFSF